ncbi:MAG: hypothetical protein AAF517_10560 [Planctomycetota bacterium]
MTRVRTLSQRLIALSLIFALALAQGCSFTQPANQMVQITTAEGAEIFVDNLPVGTGTASPQLVRNKSHVVRVELNGDKKTAYIGMKISTMGLLDVVGGFFFLVPFVGAFAPGFFDLDPAVIHVQIGGSGSQPPPKPKPTRGAKDDDDGDEWEG